MGTYYKQVEPWLERIDMGAWIELGVDRGEGSTRWFSDLAETRATKFYGVDMDPEQIARARVNLSKRQTMRVDGSGPMVTEAGELPDHVHLVVDKGETFLQNLAADEQISLLYLDNFDWDYWLGRQEEAFVAGVKQRYRDTINTEMTNGNSQLTHLLQAIYAVRRMTANSLVICDDTWYLPSEGIFSGKCSAVIPFLLLQGFRLLHHQGYRQNSGAILGRFQDG